MKIPQSSILFFLMGMMVPSAYSLSVPAPKRLRLLLEAEMNGARDSEMPLLLPCCYDGLTARLVAKTGFEITFMTGFGVSATHGFPDTQLISYAEMQSAASFVAEGLASAALEMGKDPIPCIADGEFVLILVGMEWIYDSSNWLFWS
jgi:Phosphoenolpyruvate phosphomutase